MIRDAAAVVILVLGWLAFTVAAAAAGFAGLATFLAGDWEYGRKQFRAIDRAAAALLGWDDRYTISAQCGAAMSGCRFCAFVRWLLEWRWPNHCRDQAVREGLQPQTKQ